MPILIYVYPHLFSPPVLRAMSVFQSRRASSEQSSIIMTSFSSLALANHLHYSGKHLHSHRHSHLKHSHLHFRPHRHPDLYHHHRAMSVFQSRRASGAIINILHHQLILNLDLECWISRSTFSFSFSSTFSPHPDPYLHPRAMSVFQWKSSASGAIIAECAEEVT